MHLPIVPKKICMNNHVYSIKQYLNRWNRVNKLNIQINYLSNLNFDDLALIFFENHLLVKWLNYFYIYFRFSFKIYNIN